MKPLSQGHTAGGAELGFRPRSTGLQALRVSALGILGGLRGGGGWGVAKKGAEGEPEEAVVVGTWLWGRAGSVPPGLADTSVLGVFPRAPF